MLEAAIEYHLCHGAHRLGVDNRKVRWIGRRHAPDRVLMVFGGIYVECKAPGETLRPGQEREHERMREAGFDVRVVDSIAAADALLKEIEHKLCHANSRRARTKRS